MNVSGAADPSVSTSRWPYLLAQEVGFGSIRAKQSHFCLLLLSFNSFNARGNGVSTQAGGVYTRVAPAQTAHARSADAIGGVVAWFGDDRTTRRGVRHFGVER